MSFWEKLIEWWYSLWGSVSAQPVPEQPEKEVAKAFKLAIVVGHTKIAQGAENTRGDSEYKFNNQIAAKMAELCANSYKQIDMKIFLRDGVGISGAYAAVKKFGADLCIELHFNAANGAASGTETLSSSNSEDMEFSRVVQKEVCSVFGRTGKRDRGVKVVPPNGRGGESLSSLPGKANCLVEPFFGDNYDDCELAYAKSNDYAEGLLKACVEYWKQTKNV